MFETLDSNMEDMYVKPGKNRVSARLTTVMVFVCPEKTKLTQVPSGFWAMLIVAIKSTFLACLDVEFRADSSNNSY